MGYENLSFEKDAPIARITVNRPSVMNAMNLATLDEMIAVLGEVADSPEVRVAILTGAGEKAFIAGADIRELAHLSALEARAFARKGQHVCHAIQWLGKPVIAAVNGFALGGGCEVALACHIRLGSTEARLGQPEVMIGAVPGWGGTQRLPRIVGLGRGLEMILGGDPIGAEEAYRIGLLNRVVAPEELMPACEELARRIASRAPVAVRLAMDAVQRGMDGPMTTGLLIEADAFGLAASTGDWREGAEAFLAKRPPEFRGE